ncbi:MAG: hypothetical protein IJN80_01895 [Clostridia bacterium]|nr:hypothetical protein [Clostridia bacterium]
MKMKKRPYDEQIHIDGRIWGAVAAVAICAFPLLVAILFRLKPDWGVVLKGLIGVAPIFWTVGLIEVFTYIPMLGAGSSYLAFVTGNITNLKAPCAINAMENAEVKAGSKEAEIISTIAVATSSIVTILIIALGVLMIVPLTPILENPTLTPAFDNILPALFGALGVVYISRNWKLAIAPVAVMLVLFIAVPGLSGAVGMLVPVGAIIAIAVARVLYKKGKL